MSGEFKLEQTYYVMKKLVINLKLDETFYGLKILLN